MSISSLPFALNVSSSAEAAPAGSVPVTLHKVIFDDRYAEGRSFAAAVGKFGVPVRALDNGDVTGFWYDELDALWRERAAAIAGLTQFGPMFVLERLARERGMGVAMRVEHRADSAQQMTHAITAPPETVIHYYTSASIRDGQGVPWDGPLFSWLIAPGGRV